MYLQAGGPALLMYVFFPWIRICSDLFVWLTALQGEFSFCVTHERPDRQLVTSRWKRNWNVCLSYWNSSLCLVFNAPFGCLHWKAWHCIELNIQYLGYWYWAQISILPFGCVDIGNTDIILRLNTKCRLDGQKWSIAVVLDFDHYIRSSSTNSNTHTQSQASLVSSVYRQHQFTHIQSKANLYQFLTSFLQRMG
jgi:hypothetical protein